jgi:dTDP-4-amino-4,6-dideoxygalactose transaminase
LIPYAKHKLEAEDIIEVMRALQGPSITQGTMIDWFEDVFREAVGAKYAVAVSSGTAALHASLMAIGIGPGDEVIVPSMTFVATANVVKYLNATPIFADIDPETLLVDPEDIEKKITNKTRAIIVVDFSGQPVDYSAIKEICERYHLILIADACHSLGATYKGEKVGKLADLNCFSLHATKLITSAEGGVITTDDKCYYDKMRAFRNHGRIDGDMMLLGYNYRMTHLQAALCINQIKRIPNLVAVRQTIAEFYDNQLKELGIKSLKQKVDRTNARHIYVIFAKHREALRSKLEIYGIGSQIHYKPITLQSYYDCPGSTPRAEDIWRSILTIPLYHHLIEGEQKTIIRALKSASEYVENYKEKQ